ncbi:MFS transporter [Streptomyces sp. DH24]|uniref:MFS transporter n=1 Tax=Streptomyces sp. DH24 TaxID=3040123 RepID=UPI0024411E93|nr:MFS transporter [Streptomyces sp. DH24]MDG9716071.1 MFS transporter [Streptomyces sp. DH24]
MKGVDRRFLALASAHAVSTYGNYLNLIALGLFSYEITGTAFGVGAVMALRLGAGFLAGLAAGALSARAGRRTVMICTDLAQGAAMAVLALWAVDTPLWLLAGAVVVLGAGNTWFNVSLRSAIPVMVGQESRVRANGLLVATRSLATVLGFASAAPVIGYGGFAVAFAINGASFAVSAAAVLMLRPRTDDTGPQPPAAPGDRGEAASPHGEVRGPRLRRAAAGVPLLLFGMILLRGVDALASASHNVALPVVANATHPDQPAVAMTRFWTAWAVGTVLAHLVLRRSRREAAWGERAFAVGTCAMSLSFVAAFLGLPAFVAAVAALSAGFADGWTEIVYTSRLQAVPDRQRSRLFGLSATAEQSGFALGTVAAAAALETFAAPAVVAAFHGAAMCGALTLLLCTVGRRGAREPQSPKSGADGKDGGAHGAPTGANTQPGA